MDTLEHKITLRQANRHDIVSVHGTAAVQKVNYGLVYFVRSELDGHFEGPYHLKTEMEANDYYHREFQERFKAGMIWIHLTQYEIEKLTQ